MIKKLVFICFLLSVVFLNPGCQKNNRTDSSDNFIDDKTIELTKNKIFELTGGLDKSRIIKGVEQLAGNWWKVDGTEDDFIAFCTENFLIGDNLNSNFEKICTNYEVLRGYSSKIKFAFTQSERFTDAPELIADEFFRKNIPQADPYEAKLAHFIQLNFPHYSLEEKRELGDEWTREKWAMVALGDIYSNRQNPDFKRVASEEASTFKKHMQHYFLRMDHICLEDGSFPFPEGSLLHSHRGLRDNCKEEYTRDNGYERQRLTGKVVEHILLGTIPKAFLDDESSFWNPWTNELYKDSGQKEILDNSPEDLVRYEGFRSVFLNRSSEDVLYPEGSTVFKRNFNNQGYLPEEVEKIIREFLSDPAIAKAAKIIEEDLDRPLEPFDLWYSGFQEQSSYSADFLDSITRSRYPDPISLQEDVPNILINMGFSKEEAEHIGAHTTVRPVVSGGYTNSPPIKGDNALMTTMFREDGLDYKGYRVAMHELGHVVCAVYSDDEADRFIMSGVPTSGITEAMAELLAYKNVEGLALGGSSAEEREHKLALAALWYLVEMGGQALTDIESWKWMYAHPGASGEEVKEAILSITEEIWNQYFSNVFGGLKDQHILSIYNHYITGSLYLYNYFMGNVIMFQLYEAYRTKDMGQALRQACKEGNTLPGLWMQKAVGSEASTKALIKSSELAVKYFQNQDL